MPDDRQYDLELDLKGLICPMPMVRVSQSISSVPVGGVLKAVATDPACEADIPAWARLTGNEVLSIEKDGGTINAVREAYGLTARPKPVTAADG